MRAPPDPKGVSSTAFLVAYWRAEEAALREPLFADPYAAPLLLPSIGDRARALSEKFPMAAAGMRYRTRFFDDAVCAFHRAGGRQALILGSGLDTRPARLALEGLRWFECDGRETLEFKRSALSGALPSYPATLVAGDYREEKTIDALASAIDGKAPLFILWEGNTFYVEVRRMEELFDRLAARFSGIELAFDCPSQAVVEARTGDERLDAFSRFFREQGAPWVSGWPSVRDLLVARGFELDEGRTVADFAASLGFDDPAIKIWDGQYSLHIARRK